MSAVPVAPQALQDPATESIEPPSVDRELLSVRILHQACAHCPLGGRLPDTQQDRRVKQAEVEVKVEQRPDFLHLSLGLSLNLLESRRTFSASCYRMNSELRGWITRGGSDYGRRGAQRDQGS